MKPSYYKRLFKKYGIAPKRGSYLEWLHEAAAPQCIACAIGLRFVHAMKSLDASVVSAYTAPTYRNMVNTLCDKAGMSTKFASGLDSGWESRDGINQHEGEYADFDAGFNEGRAAALACIRLDPFEQ